MKHLTIKPLKQAFLAALPAIALAVSPHLHANMLHYNNHWVRDYLDFGQNKGVFKPGAVGVTIQKKDGSLFKLPDLPLPDFSAAEIHGAAASLGSAFGLTVRHNNLNGGSILRPQYGHSIYQKVDHMLVDEGKADIAYLRYNKFVVETTGYDEGADFSLTNEQALERYGTDYQGKRRILIYRVGNGSVNLSDGKTTNGFLNAYNRDFQTGGIYESLYQWGQGHFQDFDKNTFKNQVTSGDSGSMALVYDNVQKKWVVYGTTAFIVSGGGHTWYRATSFKNADFKKFKEKWSKDVALNGSTLTFNEDATGIKVNGGSVDVYRGSTLAEGK